MHCRLLCVRDFFPLPASSSSVRFVFSRSRHHEGRQWQRRGRRGPQLRAEGRQDGGRRGRGGALPVRAERGHPCAARAAPGRLPSSLEEQPVNVLLYDMNGRYSRLKELVPTLPQNRKVSRVEILQHVIDYIWASELELN